jgi:hypothetical protein
VICVCKHCGDPFEPKTLSAANRRICAPCWATYIRDWNRRHGREQKARRRLEIYRLVRDGFVDYKADCPNCGGEVRVTAARHVYRQFRCSRCRVSDRCETQRRQRALFPEKYRARRAVAAALRSGQIARGACTDCGADDAEAHHHDYAKPLEVTWLCGRCHVKEHWRQKFATIEAA